MKNHYQENLKNSAKLYHRNKRNSNFFRGLIQFHEYGIENASSRSWWDKVDFILNDYRVIVAWNHPRYAFQKFIESEARKSITHLDVNMDDMFSQPTPNYVKAGQSRKIIKGYTINKFPEEFANWSEAYNLALQELPHSFTYQVKPSIKTQWLAYGYLINVCAPIEVLSVDDLVQLVSLVKRLLLGETNLNREFPDYIYSKEQWLTEFRNIY